MSFVIAKVRKISIFAKKWNNYITILVIGSAIGFRSGYRSCLLMQVSHAPIVMEDLGRGDASIVIMKHSVQHIAIAERALETNWTMARNSFPENTQT